MLFELRLKRRPLGPDRPAFFYQKVRIRKFWSVPFHCMSIRTVTALTIGILLIAVGSVSAQTLDAKDASTAAIRYATQQGWMSAFADGSFRADRPLTRAELLKVVLLAAGKGDEASRCIMRRSKRMVDVPADAWFARYVCAGLRFDLLVHPSDGRIHPARKVTLAEAAKVLSLSMIPGTAVQGGPWYEPHIRQLAQRHALPPSLVHHSSYVTRGELAEMLYRLKEQDATVVSADVEQVLHGNCTRFEEPSIPGVDLYEVKHAWLGWYNDVRGSMGLQPLTYQKQLTRTAALWSKQAADTGSITHKRAGQTAYYDYTLMTSWFKDMGIEFANVDRTTFTENIGWGVYSCPKDGDCTQRFIDAVRSTFDFYMAEKGKTYSPHYNSIVNPEFRQIGLGIVTKGNRYYLTAHYGTKITSSPAPVCP
jgi:uncharacterized protein YkwD